MSPGDDDHEVSLSTEIPFPKTRVVADGYGQVAMLTSGELKQAGKSDAVLNVLYKDILGFGPFCLIDK